LTTTAKADPCTDRRRFFLLAIYVLAQATYTLSAGLHPAPSILGTVSLIVSMIAMLLLAWGKLIVVGSLPTR
jgi:hypothetical protein